MNRSSFKALTQEIYNSIISAEMPKHLSTAMILDLLGNIIDINDDQSNEFTMDFVALVEKYNPEITKHYLRIYDNEQISNKRLNQN